MKYNRWFLTWSFGSSSQNAPQAKDNGSLILLHNLCAETNHINGFYKRLLFLLFENISLHV